MKFEDMINTIQLGDCYELIKQIPDKSIDLVIIDPPYLFPTGGKHTGIFKTRDTRCFDEIAEKGLDKNFDITILDELCRVMKYIYIYIWCNKEQIHQYLDYFEKKDCIFEIIIWHKTNPIPCVNNKYLTDKEYCLMFRKKGTKLYGDVETKKTVYSTPINVKDKGKFNHPTIKNINIIKNTIVNSSKKNDIVLDCFVGSGTTCVAAKELGRRYIGMEIDPEYHKIAVDRLNGITANGQTSIFTDFDNL